MKVELTEVSETQRQLSFEVPADRLEEEIGRVAVHYSRTARVAGFRQGKVPVKVIRQRYKDQILYDAAHDLIPQIVGDALRERGLDPVETPSVKDMKLEEGHPLTFVADFEVVPAFDPGEYTGLALRKSPAVLDVGAVDQALERLRQRAAKWVPVEDRPSAVGDSLLVDLTRTVRPRPAAEGDDAPTPAAGASQTQHVNIELGADANPPGFDDHLVGTVAGDHKQFTVTFPADHSAADLAGATVDYDATVKGVRRKDLAPLDDDFAKEISDLETLDALRDRVRDDLQQEAEQEAEHKMRHSLIEDLAGRVKVAIPALLIDREVERRLEDLITRLVQQGIDPRQAQIDWEDLRARQRAAAESAVKSTLVLDAIAAREHVHATDEDVTEEIARFARRSGRTPEAVRAHLEKDEGLDRIQLGIQREKTMAWLIANAHVVTG